MLFDQTIFYVDKYQLCKIFEPHIIIVDRMLSKTTSFFRNDGPEI